MRTPLPFVGGFRQNRSSAVADQTCINFYPETVLDDQGKPAFRILVGTPGRKLFTSITPAYPCRGWYKAARPDKIYFVFGPDFYEVSNDGSFVNRGSLKTDSGPVYMKDNGTHILIVDGSSTGYVYTMATGAWNGDLHATAADFVGGDSVAFVGGYFFVINPGTNIIQSCTAPYGTAPTTWFAADAYSTALTDAGPLIALGGQGNNELWAFGDYSTTIFQNTANPTNFPFTELVGANLPVGIGARNSLRNVGGSFHFLAKTKDSDRFIVRTQGYGITRISTPELEYAISKYVSVSDADAFDYNEQGHSFYQITFTVGNQTWVYDAANPVDWHERKSSDLSGRHRNYGLVQFFDKKIVADRTIGNLYEQNLDLFSDDENPIIRSRRFQRVKNNLNEITINGVVIDAETGIGLEAGPPDAPVQGEDPSIALKYSWNGGKNWSRELVASAGKLGQRNTDIRYPKLGQGNDWSYEFTVSDPVRWQIMGFYIEI